MSTAVAEILALGQEIARLQSRLVERVAEVHQVEGWRYDGAPNVESWLVARLGVSRHTALALADVAQRLPHLPEIGEGLASGRLSFDQVRVLCQFATAEEDTELAAGAETESVARLQRQARRRQRVTAAQGDSTPEAGSFRWWNDGNARLLRFQGALSEPDGAVLVAAIRRQSEKAPLDPNTGLSPSLDRRHADALVQMASQSLGADSDPDRATVVVHVVAGSPHSAEVENGPVISDEAARRLACDARIETIVEDSGGVAIGVGRATRRIPAWLGRQLRYRDHGCRFPGCERLHWVHGHHLVHWADGGPTDLDNLITLCGYHHRLVHERSWHITGDPNHEVTWIRPDGTPYDPRRTRFQQAVLAVSATRLIFGDP